MFPGPITVLLRLTLAAATVAGPVPTAPGHLQLPPGLMTTGSVAAANHRTAPTTELVDLAALHRVLHRRRSHSRWATPDRGLRQRRGLPRGRVRTLPARRPTRLLLTTRR